MYDPVGGFYRIREQYLTYLETAFRISDPGVSAERRRLLLTPGVMCTEPLVEPLARYRGAGWPLADLGAMEPNPMPGISADALDAVTDLVCSGLFDSGELSLYLHQVAMARRGTTEGTPGIVTSGTGSGKTESFLLPILARIVEEGRGWSPPEPDYLQKRWWHSPAGVAYDKYTAIPKECRPLKAHPLADPFVAHRSGEHRPAAVRSLVLYPMNALVEDQLARVRKALDSPTSRSVLDNHLNGNRIFFGRYTSETPVTGFNVHPRLDPEVDRNARTRRLQALFDRSTEMEQTQSRLRQMIARGELSEEDRYLFPSVDGAELLTRWDIQLTPPDILISNISMLGAMLNREVDAPIFDATRDWIASNEDSYFYLVLDELHLHRGTSGTEVAYLVRLLLHRLGLTDPAHRHKLRILASSASLPTSGTEAAKSLQYLWDMFGSHGTWKANGDHATGPYDWADAIVAGEAEPDPPLGDGVLPIGPFADLTRELGGDETNPVPMDVPAPNQHEALWRSIGAALGVDRPELVDLVWGCVSESGKRIAAACWSERDGRARATTLTDLASQVFGSANHIEATRGLLTVRGLGEAFSSWYPTGPPAVAPTFRLHTFFRAIEGLYASLDGGASAELEFRSEGRTVGRLSIERALGTAGGTGNRIFDVLYCESCGVLLAGGRRRAQGQTVELMPTEADLESLPDSSGADRFEDFSFDDYAVFFPTADDKKPEGGHAAESWVRSALNPRTGETFLRRASANEVPGWRYQRTARGIDRHHRTSASAGTNVPYRCPSCKTDYSLRRADGGARLSPVRHFRPGFAKTTQLLASELFDLLLLAGDAKLVSFSDSRQEAARAALDIESRHHEDLRRLVLISEFRRLRDKRPRPEELKDQIDRLKVEIDALVAAKDYGALGPLSARLEQLEAQARQTDDPSLPLSALLENPSSDSYRGRRVDRGPLSPLLRTYSSLGIHPFDPAGISSVQSTVGDTKQSYSWTALFERDEQDEVDWRDRQRDQEFLDNARQTVLVETRKLLTEIVFSKTYFALEETGLGYPVLPRSSTEDDSAYEQANAMFRVFGDAYRLADSPYENRSKGWLEADDIGATNRVRLYAQAVWGPDWTDRVDAFLKRMDAAGHTEGLIATSEVRIRLTDPSDPTWRCHGCSRVHLHRGSGRCTRCFGLLPEEPTADAGDIARANFVGRKTERSAGGPGLFRLHCEELTGQTDNGPERQRSFRNVLIPQLRPQRTADGDIKRDDDGQIEYQDPIDFWPEREEIDLLAVTTTMEVGIDIGSLQAVLQANMPPQRFNYQQRVGRAGRRGQAFSFALTVCRTKSHDLHYFRDPHAITGDVPPPPFLARARPEIARRFLRKWWLNEAFGNLRSQADEWPADTLRPPDIHGEFVPSEMYLTNPEWRVALGTALEGLAQEAEAFAALLADNDALQVESVTESAQRLLETVDQVVRRPEVLRAGLGHSLAEAGVLPMYGMPTRVRNLYTGARRTSSGLDWRTIDRELDVAVHEFAPGSVLIKDKRSHLSVGFTGPIGPPQPGRETITPFSPAFADPFWMAECPRCRTWSRREEEVGAGVPCGECGAPMPPPAWVECREPLGFRTDFRPSTDQEQSQGGTRSRSVQAESFPLHLEYIEGTNLGVQVKPGARTYRMNRGQFDTEAERWRGFTAAECESTQRLAGSKNDYTMVDQWIDPSVQTAAWFANRLAPVGDQVVGVWLAAAKTTDVLLLAPQVVTEGLALGHLQGVRSIRALTGPDLVDGLHATAVRSAALSASFILVGRAALALDVDPEEFDIIDPRVVLHAPPGEPTPVLQFADYLVNGAGLCSALGAEDPATGEIVLGELLRSVVEDADHYPRRWFDQPEHRDECGRACYQCLLRHSNQSYHGLLDWRLGLAFLTAMGRAGFRCGLDGEFTSAGLGDWARLVDQSLLNFQARLPGLEVRDAGSLRAFRFAGSERWVVVAHPLWDLRNPTGVLADALIQVGSGSLVVDSFTLDRRPWALLDALVHNAVGDSASATSPPAAVSSDEALAARVSAVLALGGSIPAENYQPPGASGVIRYAWASSKVALDSVVSPELEEWLVVEGWSLYGPDETIPGAAELRHVSDQ